ncbi:MAG: hypothetical protein JWL76_1854 [Thermoleophilia bacterium]|nr:hypothetical protein [Thermoleophilia bacterium]
MRRCAHVLLLAICVLLCASMPAHADGWRDGNLHGGGYVVATRFHPTDSRHVLLATDVGGLHVSDDGGKTWHLRGTSHLASKGKRIADVEWHPTMPNVAYALVGDGPASSGAVLVSTDFGWTWQQLATGVAGAGNHVVAGDGLSDAHPRSIGRLIVVDPTRSLLYVGSYDAGIVRQPLAADGTASGAWSTIAMGSGGVNDRSFVRGIAIDDVDPTTLYVATAQGVSVRPTGTWRIGSANQASPTVEQLTSGPASPEELDVLDGNLYAVANPTTLAQRGLYRLANADAAAAGAAWRQVQGIASTDAATSFYGIEAERRGMQTRIWVTADDAWRVGGNPEGYHVVGRGESLDGFATDGTWTALPGQRTDAPNDVGGPTHGGVPDAFWKFGVPANGVYCWLGYDPQFTASAIAVDPNDGDTVVMAGQCTAWRSTDAGATWYPVPEGIQLLVNSRIAADPETSGRAFIASADMRGFSTTDGFVTPKLLGIKEDLPTVDSAANNANALWIDSAATPNATYLSFGDSDTNTRGYLVRNTDPFGAGDGTWEYLITPTDGTLGADQGKRIDGVGVVRDPASPTTEIVLASVQNSGIWRKVGSGPWTKASGFTTSGYDLYPATVQFGWRPGMTKVYMYDRETGLYRSDDYGATWTLVLTSPSGSNNRQGSLAVHPTNQNVVYIATYTYVRSVTNAGTAGPGLGTTLNLGMEYSGGATIGHPGAIAISPAGKIYVTTSVRQTATPDYGRIYRATADPSGTGIVGGWTDVSDNNWRAMASDVAELSVGPDETVYAGQGNATLVLDEGATSADATPPTVTRTTPAASPHTWNAPTTAAWTATDASGIELVTFRLDGVAIDARHAPPYSIVIDPAGRSVGTHQLQVTARDEQGNVASSTLDLVVPAAPPPPPPPDVTAPVLTRTSPTSNPHAWTASVASTWNATDAGGIADVTFRLDGALLSTDSAPPYAVTLDPTGRGAGTYVLQVTARDASNNTAAATLDLVVAAPSTTTPPPPPPPTTIDPIEAPVTTQPVALSPTAIVPVLSWPVGAHATSWSVTRARADGSGATVQLGTFDAPSVTDLTLAERGIWRYRVVAHSSSGSGDAKSVDVTYDPSIPTASMRPLPRTNTTRRATPAWTVGGLVSGVASQELVTWSRPSARPDAPLRVAVTTLAPAARSMPLALAAATTTCVAVRVRSGAGIDSVPSATCISTPSAASKLPHRHTLRGSGGDLLLARPGDGLAIARRGARTIVVFTRSCSSCGQLEVQVDGTVRRIDTRRGRGIVATSLPAGRRSSIALRAASGPGARPVRLVGVALLRG